MATAYIPLVPTDFVPASTGGAQFKLVDGTNFPVRSLAFDAAADEAIHTQFVAVAYGSGNLTVKIGWYADTASSGDVFWDAAICVVTPNTDSQDIETDAFATANSVTDSHIGTTGQRVHEASITVSNLDSLAADDLVHLRIRRQAATEAGDTMTGDALLLYVVVSYTAA